MSTQVDDHLKVDSLVSPSTPADGQTAVIYLRVSTKEQAEKGGGDEGSRSPPNATRTWTRPTGPH
ncbi:hypothetical protein [Bifidobacterium psychraerophilum]|uniref:hypothetical protein n=1 Tax=Bifidobacterium psychraerophilum TaxID=218140 RepID=UPI00193090BD|nr:hypothetical protein [Bifidobacterium psychraerophilum]